MRAIDHATPVVIERCRSNCTRLGWRGFRDVRKLKESILRTCRVVGRRSQGWGAVTIATLAVLLTVSAPASAQFSFAAPTRYDVAGSPVGITTADLNGDGFPDVIVATDVGL